MTMIRWACALALALIPSLALAQTTGSSVQAPAGYAPMQAPCVKQVDGSCVPVSASAPLPVTAISGGSGATADQVQGAGAAGAAATGNPVGVGGIYSTTLPTLTDGQRGNLQLGARSALQVQLMTADSATAFSGVGTANDTGSNTLNALKVYASGSLYNPGTAQWVRAPGDTSGAYVVAKGSGSMATGQISVGTSSTLVAAARAGRSKIMLNVGAANSCAFGNSGVTTTTGFPLQPVAGASLLLDTSAAIYAACSATTTVSFIEQY
ncbi:hypothetical protein [Sphingomonas sp. VDB2]|uniref:hypothetical protein n=1 Tax=Sphingomonas sp. VDB2 TaxID=3228751 RepID=UPI003A80D31A